MPLQASAKRARKPSAFAPAVGVKQSPGTSATTSSSTTSTNPVSTSQSSRSTAFKSALVHFLSGGLAAGLVRASLQPLDTCKTRLQASRLSASTATSSSLRSVLFAGGIRGLYRGVVPGVAGIVPAAAVYMLTFQTLKSQLGAQFPRRRNDAVIALSAGLADVAASFVRVPCEVLKQRLQVGVYRNVTHALRTLAQRSQVPRLYAGLSAQLVRDVPYTAAEFVVYENLKALRQQQQHRRRLALALASSTSASSSAGNNSEQSRLKKHGPAARQLQHRLQDEKLGKLDGLMIGAVAGAIAAIVSNPADVVKTRLMTQVRSAKVNVAGVTPYRGIRDAFIRIAREEGIQTFGKGIAPRIAAKAIQSAMFFAAYEGLRRAVSKALSIDPKDVKNALH